jgi:hypothetical protein
MYVPYVVHNELDGLSKRSDSAARHARKVQVLRIILGHLHQMQRLFLHLRRRRNLRFAKM